jgi:hypothetical protein
MGELRHGRLHPTPKPRPLFSLNWFAASSGQMATSFQPFTKSAYREESDALQANSTLGS